MKRLSFLLLIVAMIGLCFQSSAQVPFEIPKPTGDRINVGVEIDPDLCLNPVTSIGDDGIGTLRRAVECVPAGGTITFDASTNGNPIVLTSGPIFIQKDITIIGNGIDNTMIDGNNASQVFMVMDTILGLYPEVHLEGLTIQNGMADDPLASFGLGEYGGGIFNYGITTIEDCRFRWNDANIYGGAIMNFVKMEVANSDFIDNSTLTIYGGGAIAHVVDTIMNISNSTFTGNQSASSGGAIYTIASMDITNSTFNNNQSVDEGGAISAEYFYSPFGSFATLNLIVANTTFHGNTSGVNGGAIYTSTHESMAIDHCTFNGNEAVDGGGIYSTTDGIFSIHNSIISGNTASDQGDDGYIGNLVLASSYNIVGDNSYFGLSAANDNDIGADPMLSPLADNGGPTQTMAVQCCSPAIDAADPTSSGNDQRGLPMYSGRRDIGAFEAQSGDCDLVITVADDDGAGSLRAMIDCAQPGDTITFHSDLNGVPITLTSGRIQIDKDVTILGSGTGNTIIDGNDNSQIFDISDLTIDYSGFWPVITYHSNPAVYLEGLTIQNAFTDTSYLDLFGGSGGSIINFGVLTLYDCRFRNNEAYYGGAVANGWIMYASNCNFLNNTAFGGGAVATLSEHNMTITNSTFTGNSAAWYGGGIVNSGSVMELQNCTFDQNFAGFRGGGIFTYEKAHFVNCTFHNNTCLGFGGALYMENYSTSPLEDLSSTMDHCTISGNMADTAGGICNRGFDNMFEMNNTIVADNIAYKAHPDAFSDPGAIHPSSDFNLIKDPTGYDMPAGTGNLFFLPAHLGPLADNGGPTQTMALLCESPAIDGGDPLDVTLDQRGEPVYGLRDMGAFELQEGCFAGCQLVVTSTADSGPGTLRAAIDCAAPGDTITFDSTINGIVIYLNDQIVIDKDLTIWGNGPGNTILDGMGDIAGIPSERIFYTGEIAAPHVVISDLTMRNGNAGFEQYGGAIYVNSGQLFVVNALLKDNTAQLGGAIFNNDSSIVEQSEFIGNVAESGGAIYNARYLMLEQCSMSGGNAYNGGGVYSTSNAIVENSTLHDNTAENAGGAIYNTGHLTVYNSTIANNSTQGYDGGGIFTFDLYQYFSSVRITNSTISGNYAFNKGGGIANLLGSETIVHNSIIDGNLAGNIGNDGHVMTFFSTDTSTYNIFGDSIGLLLTYGAGNLFNVDPFLGPLTDNGGHTQTMALLCGSPATDAADPSLTSADQRGEPVFGGRRDIGAFELQEACDCQLEVVSTADSGPGTLRAAVDCAEPGDVITFHPVTDGNEIQLITQIVIDKDLTIQGNGRSNTILDGLGNLPITSHERIFYIGETSRPRVLIENLTMENGFVGVDPFGGYDTYGACMFINQGNVLIRNAWIGDHAATIGGAIYNRDSLIVELTEFSANAALSGAAICNSGYLMLDRCVIHSGYAENGGAIWNTWTAFIESSTLHDNSALYSGGAINSNHDLYIRNSTIANNVAMTSYGGGIYHGSSDDLYGKKLEIINSTISGNRADELKGGGMFLILSALDMHNTIIAGNIGHTGDNDVSGVLSFGTNTVTYSIIGDAIGFPTYDGHDNLINIDPLLIPLADNGGPTPTMALQECSPAYNVGNDTITTPTDQRGEPRYGRSDIGAYEAQNSVLCLTAIYGVVWEDMNGDGLPGPGLDAGIPGAEILVWGEGDELNPPVGFIVLTDENGEFALTELVPGIINLEVYYPQGHVATGPTTFSIYINEDDILVAYAGQSGYPDEETVRNDLNFYATEYGAVHGYKFLDLNRNGEYEAENEPPVSNVEFWISGVDGQGYPYESSTFTDENGEFAFYELLAGNYTVEEIMQPPYEASTPTSYNFELLSGNKLVAIAGQSGDLVHEVVVPALQFGNYLPWTSVHGFKFEDLDADGIYDPGTEPGLEGVEFTLYGNDTFYNAVILNTTTDADGRFYFDQLVPGDYWVLEWVPSGHHITTPLDVFISAGWAKAYVPWPGFVEIPANITEKVYGDLAFGNTVPGSIHGFVFNDANEDGVFDPVLETPMYDIVMQLNGVDGQGNAITRTDITMPDGFFDYEGLYAGSYVVEATIPPEFVATTPTVFSTELLSRKELVAFIGQADLQPGDPQFEILVGEPLMFGVAPIECLQGCPDENIRVGTDPGMCSAEVVYSMPYSICTGAEPGLVDGFPSGSDFPLGLTEVVYELTSLAGNLFTCSFTVEVYDDEPPELTCPNNFTVDTDPGECGAEVFGPQPNYSDNCPIAFIQLTGLPYGSLFPVGDTYMEFLVQDASDNIAACSFTITVEDNEPPVITCPEDIVVDTDQGECGAIINYDYPVATDNCDVVYISVPPEHGSGAFFDMGYTVVRYDANDTVGNNGWCYFSVTVEDNEAPVLTCPPDQTVTNDQGLCGAYVDYTLTHSDNCSLLLFPEQLAGLPSGAFFPVGETWNDFTVHDLAQNYASCDFSITVVDNEPPIALCRNISVNLDEFGDGGVSSDDLDNGSYDNCNIGSIQLNDNDWVPFTCDDVGSNTVSLSVTDVNGNVSSCDAYVEVFDVTPPEAECMDATIYIGEDGYAYLEPGEVDAGSTDACGIGYYDVYPSTFDCDEAGLHNVVLSVTDIFGNLSECISVVAVLDTIPPTAICQDFTAMLNHNCIAMVDPEDVDDGSYDNCDFDLVAVLPSQFSPADVGDNNVTLLVVDQHYNSATCEATVTVTKRPAQVVYNQTMNGQYSDYPYLSAWLIDQATVTGIPDKTLTFTIGGRTVSAVTDATGFASTTSLRLPFPPDLLGYSYTVEAAFAGDGCWLPGADAEPFTVEQEDARVAYTGISFASTASVNSGEATILLSATISDITSAPDRAGDYDQGNIANAEARFVNRNGSVIFIGPWLPVNPLPGDSTRGTVSYEWSVDIGNLDSESFVVGVVVNNYYYRNSTEDDAVITVSKPACNFITGGGHTMLEYSEGTLAGDDGSKCNFGFHIKFNRRGTNLKGKVTVLVRRTEDDGLHTYQIKGNRMTSLGFHPGSDYAEFTGKANVTDVTDPDNPVSYMGNGDFRMKVTDNGTPGSLDLIGLQLFSRQGELVFSSNWDGTRTLQQHLSGGNIVVHTCGNNNNIIEIAPETIAEEIREVDGIEAKAYPNPFMNKTVIAYTLPEEGETIFEVISLTGEVVQREYLGTQEGGVLHTWDFVPDAQVSGSTYLYRIISGKYVATGKLIYMK